MSNMGSTSRDIRNIESMNSMNNNNNNGFNETSGNFPKLFHHKLKEQSFNPWDPNNWKDKKSYNIVNKVLFIYLLLNKFNSYYTSMYSQEVLELKEIDHKLRIVYVHKIEIVLHIWHVDIINIWYL